MKRWMFKMENVKSSTSNPKCPKCNSEFKINIQCMVELEKGDVDRESAIGYLMQLKCRKCKTIFPYFRNTCESEILNEAINNNKKLIKENHIGKVGVGMAQQMISALDNEKMVSYMMGMLKHKP